MLCNRPARDLLGVPAGCAPPMPVVAFVAQARRLDEAARAALLAALGRPSAEGAPPSAGARPALAMMSGQGLALRVECLAEGAVLATLSRDLAGLPPDRTDALTGLSDRRRFRGSLATLLAGAGESGRVAVLMIELDGFKAVDDTQDHQAGDTVLHLVAQRLRGTVRIFDAELDLRARVRAQHALLEDLRRALKLRQVAVHYRPRLDPGSGALAGFAARVGWRHPRRGLMPPDRFIPLAEDTDLIIPSGEWVLRTACQEAASRPARCRSQ